MARDPGRVGRKCSICEHADCAAIDKALVTKACSLRTIADRFGVSKTALIRHRDNHIPKLVQAAEGARTAQEATSGAALIEELDRLLSRAKAILDAAEQDGALRVALQAIREARETIKTCAELAVTTELEARIEALEERLDPAGRLRKA